MKETIRAVLAAVALIAAAGSAEAQFVDFADDARLRGTGEVMNFRVPIPSRPFREVMVLTPMPTTPIDGAIISSSGNPYIVAGGEDPGTGFQSIGPTLVFDFTAAGEYATAFAITGVPYVGHIGMTVYDTAGMRLGQRFSVDHPNPYFLYEEFLSVAVVGDTRIGRVELTNSGGAFSVGNYAGTGVEYYGANGAYRRAAWQGSMTSQASPVPEPPSWVGVVTGVSIVAVPAVWSRRKRASPQVRST